MNVLVDTSVWIDHFRHGNDALVGLLNADRVLTHPMIAVELACGTVPTPRAKTLDNIKLLRNANAATLSEISDLIERETLFGLGCGLIDFALLASTLLTPQSTLWTLDRRLNALAIRFGVTHIPAIH